MSAVLLVWTALGPFFLFLVTLQCVPHSLGCLINRVKLNVGVILYWVMNEFSFFQRWLLFQIFKNPFGAETVSALVAAYIIQLQAQSEHSVNTGITSPL